MTKDKDLKRLIRARMDKTGESYTAARAQLLAERPSALPDDYEVLAGMSDAAVSKATGRSWPEWAAELDRVKASAWEHAAIATHLRGDHDLSDWWAQMITVAYERLRGLRDVGQRRGGGYDVNRSRTIGVPVARLWRAFEDERERSDWLPEPLTIRTATKHRSMRIRLADDSPLDVHFTDKGEAKSAVSLQHRGLPDRESADRMREHWGERLSALAALLEACP